MALFFIAAGLNHFRTPETYLSMMPPYLPWPHAINLLSGIAEILGGLGGLMPVRTVRIVAGWGLLALLIAVFPANVHVAVHGWPGVEIPAWVLWVRLPFQPLLVAWVYDSCLRRQV